MSRASKLSPRLRVYPRRVDVPRRVRPPKPVAGQRGGQSVSNSVWSHSPTSFSKKKCRGKQ
eukprot:2951594-Prymnesium_polylepis.1